jgi:hypothetical protein
VACVFATNSSGEYVKNPRHTPTEHQPCYKDNYGNRQTNSKGQREVENGANENHNGNEGGHNQV